MSEDIFNAGKKDKSLSDLMAEQTQFDKQKRINYGLIFSTREGFEVLKDIMDFCHVNRISYVQGDTHETALREGERNVFLYILSNLSDEMKQRLIIGG